MKTLVLVFLSLCLSVSLSCASRAERNQLDVRSITVNERLRSYYLHVPASLPKEKNAPLVMVFHGGGGEGQGAARHTKFNELADKENFIVVYPNGIRNNWNDGREDAKMQAHLEKIDDVAFVNAMIDAISKEYKIDAKRIYATGISNGGIFSHYLAANLSNRIAAIAPVVGGMADPFHKQFKPEKPVSVLIFQGTADPLVPYDGGDIARGGRGKIISTDETVKLWTKHDGLKEQPTSNESFDNDKADDCAVEKRAWSGGKDKTEVVLYKLIGAGHTWPGSSQYLPRVAIGGVCREINATEIIWEFFKQHPKQ